MSLASLLVPQQHRPWYVEAQPFPPAHKQLPLTGWAVVEVAGTKFEAHCCHLLRYETLGKYDLSRAPFLIYERRGLDVFSSLKHVFGSMLF